MNIFNNNDGQYNMHQNNPLIAELNYSSLRQLELKLKIYKDGYITVSDFISLQELDNDIHLYNGKEKNTRGIMCKVDTIQKCQSYQKP